MNGNIVYLSHGGGPIPVLGGQGHEKMIQFLKSLPGKLPAPDEILVISAHWEEPVPTIIGCDNPPLLYDYYGFPEESYKLQYPAPGNPQLAREEHLLPLHVCFRLSGEKGEVIFDDYILGKRAVAFRW